jgi:hypothetical protein
MNKAIPVLRRCLPVFLFVTVLFPGLASAQQSGNIPLAATVAQNCTIAVTPTAAAGNLDLSDGVKRVQVGTILQNCNKKAGYRLTVDSDNCGTGTPGAKLIGAALPPDTLSYSVEFNNPPTGGSALSVTDLLSTQCTGDAFILGRATSGAKISNENSTVYANYTGDSALGADSYSDTIRITMTVN